MLILLKQNFRKLVLIGLVSSVLSGFFGIGGGFLILLDGCIKAIGFPFVAVTAFCAAPAINYAVRPGRLAPRGEVHCWWNAGRLCGSRLASKLQARQLNATFPSVIVTV